MSDTEPIALFGAEAVPRSPRKSQWHSFNANHPSSNQNKSDVSHVKVAFNRQELNSILSVYGRQVGAGEWRDYAIYHGSDCAIFSVFRRTSEMPLYTVEKRPALSKKQGVYSVVAAGGMILRRGHDLKQVLRVIDRKLKLLSI